MLDCIKRGHEEEETTVYVAEANTWLGQEEVRKKCRGKLLELGNINKLYFAGGHTLFLWKKLTLRNFTVKTF